MALQRPDIAGTGGGLGYLTEAPDSAVVNQELPYSCQTACARQLLLDAGIDVAEARLNEIVGYWDGIGTFADRVAEALTREHPHATFRGGAISPEAFPVLVRQGPWIASVVTSRGTIHSIIIDRREGDILHVRDPWGLDGPGSGSGTRATMRVADFLERWHLALNKAVFAAGERKEGP